jgi:hypothetical protein
MKGLSCHVFRMDEEGDKLTEELFPAGRFKSPFIESRCPKMFPPQSGALKQWHVSLRGRYPKDP